MPSPKLNATVTHRQELHPELIVLRVAPDNGAELPDFKPGQYIAVGLPGNAPRVAGSDPDEQPTNGKLIMRAYSIASSSKAKEYLELYVNLVRSGEFTPRLFALQPGDKLWMAPKIKGMFTLDKVPNDKHVIMIATGTGLAPYMSMLRTDAGCNDTRRYALLLGARHSWDLGYHKELQDLAATCDTVAYAPIISRPENEETLWQGPKGHVQDLWKSKVIEEAWGFVPTPENSHIFLCGNPTMIEQFVDILEGYGFVKQTKLQPGQIHIEEYW